MYWVVGLVAILGLGFLYETISRQRDRSIPMTGRLVDVGGYRLHVTESGIDSGGPTVVVIHGAGDSSYSWLHIRNEVAKFARIVTYDRPGIGSSDPGPAPDAARSIAELRTLLERAGIPGPYVFVGHSLGGLFARLYAIRYPDEVAGMVLVDSTHEFLLQDAKFLKTMAAIGSLAKVSKVIARFGILRFLGNVLGVMPMYPERRYYQEALSGEEYRQWTSIVHQNTAGDGVPAETRAIFAILQEANRQMKTGAEEPQFGATPMAVLTNPGFGANWAEMHRELAARSTNSIHQICDRKGHSVQMTRPELVIDAIRHVLAEARAQDRQAGG